MEQTVTNEPEMMFRLAERNRVRLHLNAIDAYGAACEQ